MTAPTLGDAVRARARALGFDVCAFARADAPWLAGDRLRAFVAQGRHGEMTWMETTLERRAHPARLWPEARSAVVLGMNYGPDADPLEGLARRDRGLISVYAQGDDYHEVIKGRLKTLGGFLASRSGGALKVFVDTAPLMEKPLAERAGLGWQGKHTNLVSAEYGSWLFLGVILTTAELPPDAPARDQCGSCRRCLEACPTSAFPAPYQLDARRCVSYLTIEHPGPIPLSLRPGLGNRVYGCDDCLAVCPWNKWAQVGREQRLAGRAALSEPRLEALIDLEDAAFRALFARSPVRRIGRDRLVRNALYAAGNSDDPGLLPAARRRLRDASALVRGAAAWAFGRLADPSERALEAERARREETDASVLAEWTAQRAEACAG